MRRAAKIVGALVVLAIIAVGAFYFYQTYRARKAGILSEDIVRDGDTWKVAFTARVPAPEQAVFDAIEHVENSHSDNVKSVKVLSQNGNQKTVEMQLAAPGGQTITTDLAFEYFPAEGRVVYKTLKSPLLDTTAEYKLSDQGANTLIDFHQTTRMLQNFPVPDAMIKEMIRGIFISQLEGLQRTLNIASSDDSDAEESDEP